MPNRGGRRVTGKFARSALLNSVSNGSRGRARERMKPDVYVKTLSIDRSEDHDSLAVGLPLS